MLFSVSMSGSCLHFPRKHLLVEGEMDFKGAPWIFLANLPIGVSADRLHMPITPLSRSTWPAWTKQPGSGITGLYPASIRVAITERDLEKSCISLLLYP